MTEGVISIGGQHHFLPVGTLVALSQRRQFPANLFDQPANCAGRNFQPQNLFGRDLGSLEGTNLGRQLTHRTRQFRRDVTRVKPQSDSLRGKKTAGTSRSEQPLH